MSESSVTSYTQPLCAASPRGCLPAGCSWVAAGRRAEQGEEGSLQVKAGVSMREDGREGVREELERHAEAVLGLWLMFGSLESNIRRGQSNCRNDLIAVQVGCKS